MGVHTVRQQILAVGGNAVSAFLSWRLQATNACDVTLVWKSGFENVSQYGISFKSKLFGNERFKPYNVVRNPEEAAATGGGFDYVLLCVKALPDVYDLASVIESIVQPQHTCILVNTTNAIGVEAALEKRFPTNIVLSLVSAAEINQLGASEFEHLGSTDIWVGSANTSNPNIPASIQIDMAEALALTLSAGSVDCKVSENIRQQQFERLIGPIAFYPTSVLFECSSHSALMEKVGVKGLVSDIIDELIAIALTQGCAFPKDFKQTTIDTMCRPTPNPSIMYQDFLARRPMETEVYLGSPIKMAAEAGLKVPRLDTMYALLHNINISNQSKPASSPGAPRMSQPPPSRGQMMQGRGGRMMSGGPGPPRRGPPPGGFPPRQSSGGQNTRLMPPSAAPSRRNSGSFEAPDIEEFGHIAQLGADGRSEIVSPNTEQFAPNASDIALREREVQLRQRELALREQEMNLRRRGPRGAPPRGPAGDDDEDGYFDPSRSAVSLIDPDNFDMMSVTSRKTRAPANAANFRKNPEGMHSSSRGFFGRSAARRNSSRMIESTPNLHESILDNPLMGYSSNRYGTVDTKAMRAESRAGSMTSRIDGMGGPYYNPGMPNGAPNGIPPRRTSQSPGDPFGPNRMPRQSPPNGGFLAPQNRRSPPGVQQPQPRYPPGLGNMVAPQTVEQHAGVSTLYPKGTSKVRSLTGSASASAGSGDSGASLNLDSENSAHSSQISLGRRPPVSVR